jgi:hypothetical protein
LGTHWPHSGQQVPNWEPTSGAYTLFSNKLSKKLLE